MGQPEPKEGTERREALSLGLAVAAGLFGMAACPAEAQPYRADEGVEASPGVRRVFVGERATMLPGYKRVRVMDVVHQPGAAKTLDAAMPNDMICQCIEGQMRLDHRDGNPISVKKGDVWTCSKGEPEDVENTGSTMAIMRVINLLPS